MRLLNDLYRLATLLVLPSLCEGFGFPMLEAMASGVPIAASKTSALPEIGQDAARYFDPSSVEEMSQVILQVLEDESLRHRLVERGRLRLQDFSWNRSAEQTLSFYRQIVGGGAFMIIAVDGYELVKPVGGVGRVTESLLREAALILSEHDFRIFTRKEYEGFPSPNVQEEKIGPDRGYFWWQNGPFRKKLQALKPDLLFAPNYWLPLFYRGKAVFILHDISFVAHPEWFSRKEALKAKWLVKKSLKQAAVVITVSEFSRAEILRFFPATASEKVKVVSHGVDERFQPASDEQIREWKGNRGLLGKKVVGFLGSIFNRRHVLELVEAVRLLRAEIPDVVLYVVGPDRTHPPQNLKEVFHQEWIRWEPGLPDEELSLFYSSLDVFAYLSTYEGFGLPPLEALACGTIPLLVNQTSLKEIYPEMAFMVESAEPETIKEGLKAALTLENNKLTRLNQFAEKRSYFAWQRAGRELADILVAAATSSRE